MSWLLLLGAIVSEVGATLSLRMAATGDRRWYLPVVAGYLLAFGLLSVVLPAHWESGVMPAHQDANNSGDPPAKTGRLISRPGTDKKEPPPPG